VTKDESLLLSSLPLSEPIKMSDSSLMFSKKSFDQNDFFIGEPKKLTEKKEYL
jgi:hypothetical protein